MTLSILSGPARDIPAEGVPGLFRTQAARTPDGIALVHAGRKLTYRELDQASDRVAAALLQRDLPSEAVVGVFTQRTPVWVVALLGVLKAGCAYLPLDPHHPSDRLAEMLGRSESALVLVGDADADNVVKLAGTGTERVWVSDLAYGDTVTPPSCALRPDQLAYVFFTSGSTGRPKGAACEHAGFTNHLLAKIEDLGITAADTLAQTATHCFDISLWQVLAPLLVGGRCCLVDTETQLDPPTFVDALRGAGVTIAQLVPSYLEVLLAAGCATADALATLRLVSVTGEALKPPTLQAWSEATGIRLVNAYGATESCDDVTHAILDAPASDGIVPLGRPVRNVHLYVLDDNLRPVAAGEQGQIAYGGVCVGRGYLHDAATTAQTFVDNPWRRGERMYLSGDVGTWSPAGYLTFQGRTDDQVKLRGFRIELGDVESAALCHPGVSQAAAVVTHSDNSDMLCLCVVAQGLEGDELLERIAEVVPDYMVPQRILVLDHFPLNGNGKTDRRELAHLLEQAAPQGSREKGPSTRPLTEAETRLAALWANILGPTVNVESPKANFFQLGGTSASAIRLALATGRALNVRDITENPVLADMALLAERGWLA